MNQIEKRAWLDAIKKLLRRGGRKAAPKFKPGAAPAQQVKTTTETPAKLTVKAEPLKESVERRIIIQKSQLKQAPASPRSQSAPKSKVKFIGDSAEAAAASREQNRPAKIKGIEAAAKKHQADRKIRENLAKRFPSKPKN